MSIHEALVRHGGVGPPGSFPWFELQCRDPASAAEFYGAVFGWTLRKLELDGFSYSRFEHPDNDAPLAGLLPSAGYGPARWLSYLAVAGLGAATQQLAEHGGERVGRPSRMPGLGVIARVADPQGAHLFLLASEGPRDIAPPLPSPNSFAGAQLWTATPERAAALYAQLVPWRAVEREAGDWSCSNARGEERARLAAPPALAALPLPRASLGWQPRVVVADVSRSLARALAAGAELLWCAPDQAWAALRDPVGASLILRAGANLRARGRPAPRVSRLA